MTRKGRRLLLIGLCGVVLSGATALVFAALGDKVSLYRTPTEIAGTPPTPGTRLRIGGLVEPGSIAREGAVVRFAVTDGNNRIKVAYTGLLPDLFREGQGTVAEGVMEADGALKATSVLAKHDENYMPKEVADSLKASGHWKDGK